MSQFLADLQAAHNDDLASESKAKTQYFTRTGTYTATVEGVEPGLMRDQTPKLTLTLQLVDESGRRAGKNWLDVTPVELTKFDGSRRRETQLYYDLFALSGAADVAEFVALLENGMLTFALYGSEYFNAPVDKLPLSLVDEEYIDEDGEIILTKGGKIPWQMTFIDADDDALRQRFLDAEQRSRFMVLRVSKPKVAKVESDVLAQVEDH